MAPFETRRTMKVLQVDSADLTDCASLVSFVTAGLGLIMPDSILNNLHFDCIDESTIHWSWEPGRCFAFKGMSQMGRIDDYECGVLFRILCWLEVMKIAARLEPDPVKCLFHETGVCQGDFTLTFPG